MIMFACYIIIIISSVGFIKDPQKYAEGKSRKNQSKGKPALTEEELAKETKKYRTMGIVLIAIVAILLVFDIIRATSM